MFSTLYIALTSIATVCLAFLNKVGLAPKRVRTFLSERKRGNTPEKGRVSYWFHAASLGEYEMALPIIEKLIHAGVPLEKILITFFSPSGYQQAVKGVYAKRVMYLPLDNLWSVKSFYANYNPERALFIRYDLWYNLISTGLQLGCTFYLVNTRLNEKHFLFRWYGKPYLRLIKSFNQLFCSDSNSRKLLSAKGLENIQFTGDTRYDRVFEITQRASQSPSIAAFKANRKLMLLGSSWHEEEQLLLELLKTKPTNMAYLIAPHDISRAQDIQEAFSNYHPKRYTEGQFDSADNILILDTIGMLSSLYQYADFALVGGGFSGALHNIMEPAVWGCHISFGPQTTKFPEARNFLEAGFASVVENDKHWIAEINKLADDTAKLEEIKKGSRVYTSKNIGATALIINNLANS